MIPLLPPATRLALRTSLALTSIALAASLIASLAHADTQLVNISSRVLCQTGDAVIVNEFAIQGTGKKTVVLRGLGPSLGITGALRNPTLTLLNRGRLLDSNDNWMDNPDKQQIIDTGLAPTHNRDSAIIDSLQPGIYTAVVRGAHGKTGIGIAEIFARESSDETAIISSIGTRGFVSTGADVLISGVILTGTGSRPLLVRVLGPSLTDAGVAGALADPALELYNANGALIASNDNWMESPNADAILASGFAPHNDLEPALVASLAPGTYTAVVFGVGNTTGIGFVQFYSLANPGPELNPAPKIKPH